MKYIKAFAKWYEPFIYGTLAASICADNLTEWLTITAAAALTYLTAKDN